MKKTITADQIMDVVIKGIKTNTSVIEWGGLQVVVKRTISLMEMAKFVEQIANACFGDNGEYRPEYKAFLIRMTILETYTNITVPEDLSKCYALCYSTNLVNKVMENIDKRQFDVINKAIDEKIEYMANSNIKAVMKQMEEITAQFENLSEKMGNTFNNIDANDITKLIAAIPEGGFDEKKIVDALVEKRAEDNGRKD